MALPPPQPIPASPSPNEHAIPLAPSTPAPHRARLTSLEGQIAQLIAQRQSAERRHRAEVAELKGLLAEARGRAEEGEGEVGRCRREGEHMRQELLDDHGLYAQRAQLALLAEQLTAESLREEVRTLQIHSIMRNHKLVRFKHREARSDRQFDALEERERLATSKLAKLRSTDQSSAAERQAAQAEREATLDASLSSALKQLGRLRSALDDKEAEVARQVAETQRVESAFKAREREVAKEERERERRMREEVEEREGEVERQVEETKRVESALRVREKEVRELKKQLQAAKLASARPRTDLSEDDAGMSDAEVEPSVKPKPTKRPKAPAPAPATPRSSSPPSATVPVPAAKVKRTKPVPPIVAIAGPSSDAPGPDSPAALLKKTKVTTKVTKKEKAKAAAATVPAVSSPAAAASVAKKPPIAATAAAVEKPKKAASSAKRKELPAAASNDDDDGEGTAVVKEKKKKRKLGGGLLKTGKRFDWDVVEGSGIPTMLSPVKPSAKSALGGGLKGKSLAGRW